MSTQSHRNPQAVPLFAEGNIQVTPTRFIAGAQTYVIRNITSVQILYSAPRRTAPAGVAVIGGIMLLIGFCVLMDGRGQGSDQIAFAQGMCWVGAIFLAAGAATLLVAKPCYQLVICTAAGESRALSSPDRALVERVGAALDIALDSPQ